MTDQRFEDWWSRSPARVTLSPAAKEVARGVWQAARDDLVPDGWVVVPKEPTPEMCWAGHAAREKWPSAHCDNHREWCYSVSQPRWVAMVNAAPSVSQPLTGGKGTPC